MRVDTLDCSYFLISEFHCQLNVGGLLIQYMLIDFFLLFLGFFFVFACPSPFCFIFQVGVFHFCLGLTRPQFIPSIYTSCVAGMTDTHLHIQLIIEMGGFANFLPGLVSNCNPLISTSRVTGITGVSLYSRLH
jgi:hypothetical protein